MLAEMLGPMTPILVCKVHMDCACDMGDCD